MIRAFVGPDDPLSKQKRNITALVATVAAVILTAGACSGPKVTPTVDNTEPQAPPSPEEQAAEVARPATTTTTAPVVVEPTEPEDEPGKDPAETTPVEEDGTEDDEAEDTEEDPDGDGESDGDEDNDGVDDEDNAGSGGVNDPELNGLDENARGSVSYVNERRGEGGLAPLSVDPDLTAMADRWANQMVAEQELYHNPNLGSEKPDRFNAAGENIALSHDPTNIDDMWWNSDGHRANIMGDGYTHIGVAFVEDSSGTTWAVQVFGG